jgi:hypothetical protein
MNIKAKFGESFACPALVIVIPFSHHLELSMTDHFGFRVNSLPQPTLAVGQYDRLQEAGLATRFVKATSGNPNGRPRMKPKEPRIKTYKQMLAMTREQWHAQSLLPMIAATSLIFICVNYRDLPNANMMILACSNQIWSQHG